MRWFACLFVVLLLTVSARAEPDAAGAVAELRQRSELRRAEAYAAQQWQRDDLTPNVRAELAIQRALIYTEQALAAPPELREALWTNAESACTALLQGWPDNPRRVLLEVQLALVSLARGEQAQQSLENDRARAHFRLATRQLNDVVDTVRRELIESRLRRSTARSDEALRVDELESLEANVTLQLARTERRLGLCYPPRSPDRDDALLQAVKRLTPLAKQSPPNDLAWSARGELAACMGELGRLHAAKNLVAGWLDENPPADAAQRLTAELDSIAALGGARDSGLGDDAAIKDDRSNAAGEQHDEPFAAVVKAAEIERSAGRHASAADRYRRFALRNPQHARASESHQLAVLCLADAMRQSAPEDRAALAASYEELLVEHLALWPDDDEVRLWLGRLLAGHRDWPGAIETLQQLEPTSDSFFQSVPLLLQCYERLSQQEERAGTELLRDQLLSEATSYLQPIITGPDNRWPDPWSDLQRQTAVGLARLHLRLSSGASPYAERLLTAVLRGQPAGADAPATSAWADNARLLLAEALARNGELDEAQTIVAQIDHATVDALLETTEAIDALLMRDPAPAADDRKLGELALSLVRRLESQRSALDAAASRRLGAWRAAALAAVGDRTAAHAQYAASAAHAPDDGEIQERYAAFLSASDSPTELRQALDRWQTVEARSRRGGSRWRRARRARIELLTRLGERAEAEKLVRLTQLLYPDWNSAAPRK